MSMLDRNWNELSSDDKLSFIEIIFGVFMDGIHCGLRICHVNAGFALVLEILESP